MKSFNCASQVGKTFQEFSPFFFFFSFLAFLGCKGLRMFGHDPPRLGKRKSAGTFLFFSSPVWHLKNEIIISRAGRRRPCCCCCCSIHGPSSITSSFRFRSTDEFTVMSSSFSPPPPCLLLLFPLRSIHSNDIHRRKEYVTGSISFCAAATNGEVANSFPCVNRPLPATYIYRRRNQSLKKNRIKKKKKKIIIL